MPKAKYFGVEYPELKKYWDWARNPGVDPNTLISRDPRSFWWICDVGHSRQATVRSQINGRQCRVCLGTEILSGVNDFRTLYPDLARFWHPTLNGSKRPESIGVGSKDRYWWTCSNNHAYQSDVWNKVLGKRCRACAGFVATPGVDDFPTKYPELSSLLNLALHKTMELKGVHPGSELSFHWLCANGHTWEQSIRELVKKRKGPCSYCSNELLWTGFNDLATVKPDLAQEWDYDSNSGFTPETVLYQSNTQFLWRCRREKHSWSTSPYKRIHEKSNCPYCGNYSLLIGFNDLRTLAPDLALEWDIDANDKSPTQVIFGSHERAGWKCSLGHRWTATVRSRVNRDARRGSGCPECAQSGFDPGSPAILYFIENPRLQAFKIGITNIGTTRLNAFISKGWELLHSREFDLGRDARGIEKLMQSWLRDEVGAGPVLIRKDMGRLGGETETFSNQVITRDVVIEKLDSITNAAHF